MDIILSPPIAFLIYIPLVIVFLLVGKNISASGKDSPAKTSIYAGGEASPTGSAAPGYKPFFLTAFFFAIMHLGILVLGSGGISVISGIYIIGLILALIALLLG